MRLRLKIICIMSLLLVGCQLLSNDENLSPIPVKVEVRLLGWQSDTVTDQRLQTTIERIVAASTSISATVNLVANYDEELTSALDSDFPPDIVIVESGRLVELAAAGKLLPIGEQIEAPANNAGADFYPVLRDAFTFRGRYYCPPREFSTLAVVYNRAMFAEVGIAEPSTAWTWQDFASIVGQLTDPNSAVVGLALGADLSRWLPAMYSAGGTLTDSNETTITINSPATAAGFHILDDLWTNFSAVRPADMRTSWAGEALGKQRAAMAIEGNWVVSYLASEFPEIELGIVELPTGAQGKSTMAFSSCWAVPAGAKHPTEAIQLINQLVSADAMRALLAESSLIPARISVAEEWQVRFPQMQPFVAGAAYAHPWRFFPGFDSLKGNLEGNLQRMYKAEIAVEDLLTAAAEAGSKALQDAAAK